MPELSIGLIALPPIIVALIELAKRVGLPVQYAPWLNAVLSVGGYGLVLLAQSRPDLLPTLQTVLIAIVIFLTSAGLYDRTQTTIQRI